MTPLWIVGGHDTSTITWLSGKASPDSSHFKHQSAYDKQNIDPDNKVHGVNMGPTWVLSALDGPHVGPMNLAIRGYCIYGTNCWYHAIICGNSPLKNKKLVKRSNYRRCRYNSFLSIYLSLSIYIYSYIWRINKDVDYFLSIHMRLHMKNQ